MRSIKTLIICTALFLAQKIEPMSAEDIIIVEVTAKDVGLTIKSESTYNRNLEQRTKFRRADIGFLQDAFPRARFIFVDMWFPDLLNNETDAELSKILQNNSNVTMSGIGIHEGMFELTHPEFKNSVPEVGHIFFYTNDPKVLKIPPILCSDNQYAFYDLDKCPTRSRLRHVAIIAAEGFLRTRLKHDVNVTYNVPREDFGRFKRINLSEYKASPGLINDKLVILVNKPTPSSDTHKITKKRKLSGSEIMAELILMFSKLLPPQ